MNVALDAQFSRIETALTALVDSITSYNPSLPSAYDLLAADSELSDGLEQLAIHQHNHTRIAALRAQSDALDAKIKDTLTLLAATRKELLSTPATTFPAQGRDVSYDELLTYAKHISKFTVPPTYRPSPSSAQQEATARQQSVPPARPGSRDGVEEADGALQQENGLADDQSNGVAAGTANGEADPGVGVASLRPDETDWLNPAAQIPWVPWPSDDFIRRGALAQIQAMIEQGTNPATVERGTVDGGAPTEVKREEEEREEAQRRESFVGIAPPATTQLPGTAKVEKPAVFGGLDLYDPDGD